ncbi:MAG: transcriptional repressor [Acidobacteria bacterium]|nr:MAG: transcriptional repressor [Acidobacteriota bacterium]
MKSPARRKTQQRAAIHKAIERADRPVGPQEILSAAQADVPALGIATVYRNLRRLVADGILRVVELPGAPSRYELAGKEHHHHFHCRACDRVFEVDDCPGSIADLTPTGFRLEAHDITLYGRCRDCAGEGS